MKDILVKLIQKQDLTEQDIRLIVNSIEDNDFEESRLAGILCLLESKGVCADELFYFIQNLMEKAKTIDLGDNCIDICGTGGDKKGTFNISTAVTFVIAAAGVKVAKHGNRAVSSSSGSFDVLEALGINIDSDADTYTKAGIKFLFAQKHHPVFKNIGPLRKKLGIKTIFNMMGPLLSPANVKLQLMGVFSPDITELIAETMKMKDIKKAMVVHGDGLDEITITNKTKITELDNNNIKSYYLDPSEYGLSHDSLDKLIVKNKEESAQLILEVFKGKTGPARDIIVLNAAAALVVVGKATGFKESIGLAQDIIDSGKAMEKLEQIRSLMR